MLFYNIFDDVWYWNTYFNTFQCHANMKLTTLSNIWISWVINTSIKSKEVNGFLLKHRPSNAFWRKFSYYRIKIIQGVKYKRNVWNNDNVFDVDSFWNVCNLMIIRFYCATRFVKFHFVPLVMHFNDWPKKNFFQFVLFQCHFYRMSTFMLYCELDT